MFSIVCPHCGMYRTEKTITFHGKTGMQQCRGCGGEFSFKALPLTIVIGASGSGKSTIARTMQQAQDQVIALDGDILWRQEFTASGHQDYFDMWLNAALNIAQYGKPVVLFMGGMPDAYEACSYFQYFPQVHFIGLVAEQEDIAQRLKDRPAWRGCSSDEFIQSMLNYNRAIKEQLPYIINSSLHSPEQVMTELMEYLRTENTI